MARLILASLVVCSIIALSQQRSLMDLEDVLSKSYLTNTSEMFPHGTDKMHSSNDLESPRSSLSVLKSLINNAQAKRIVDNGITGLTKRQGLGLIQRFRRSFGYHRSRCCYMDVMCSRGCRRTRNRQRRNVETLNKSKTSLAINNVLRSLDELQTTDDWEWTVDGTAKHDKQYNNQDSRDQEKSVLFGTRNSHRRSFFRHRPKSSNFNSFTRRRNDVTSHSNTERDSETIVDNTSAEVFNALPQILDSLEYLMKNNFQF